MTMRLALVLAFAASSYSLQASRAESRHTKRVIVQMFGWNWESIADECRNFLGPAGYGYVQVSPATEHIEGPQWWTDYQPVSYNLTSKRGNRQQYQNMINACHDAGVGVIADTIWNHMAGIDGGVGVGGSRFTHYSYPGIYQTRDFHHCGLTTNDDIQDYKNRQQVQTCELLNLADLATETEYVRSRLARYTNDLLSMGVDGLRLDAAKHIAREDIANILSRLSKRPFVTQEVIFGAGEPITPNEYSENGHVQEFRYASALKEAFLGGDIASLHSFEGRGWVSGSHANVFVSNHDTERGDSSLNINSPKNAYVLAHIFSLAHPYGTPTVLSGFSYMNFDHNAGAPANGHGACSANGGSGGWRCEHRYTAISGMVQFHNKAGSTGLTNWHSPSRERIAFGRGHVAFVAINNSDDTWDTTFRTTLPAGIYCDVVSGKSNGSGACSGKSYHVSQYGIFHASVPPRGALAIHVK